MDLNEAKLLMVGAGGIGCELLKNLVLTGFTQIEVIDLDTIELSNLNRQFLFQKCHVGRPKAIIARESVLRYNPDANIIAHHDSIMNVKYNVDYFKQFSIVLNALDNKAARSHVNRLCLAAQVPLIESGSAGYLGQVTLIKRGMTECYDCLPKPNQKTFPGCTIRNTPSEPIHCIVWAKHLFNQLFGAEDPDEAVSPDGEDPENMAEAGKNTIEKSTTEEAVTRQSTRQWAKETQYNAEKLFNKLFCDDIKYLLSMAKLWDKRKPPQPLDWASCISNEEQPQENTNNNAADQNKLESHKLLSLSRYGQLFSDSVSMLKKRLEEESNQILVWDKDDEDAMNFVVAASNLRCFIFSIGLKSKFETKSLAGNIIPAIATTNAIVAGLIVLEALKVLYSKLDECKTVYLRDKPSQNNKLIVSTQLVKPNPQCYVCASKPEITVKLNLNTFTVKQFEPKILKQELNMVQPDVEIDDGTGRIIISSEPGETEGNNDKFLSYFGLTNQMALKCDDFFQNYELKLILIQCDQFDATNTKDYELVSENQLLKDLQEQMLLSKEKKQSEVEDELEATMPEEKKRKYQETFEEEASASAESLSTKKKLKSSDQSEMNNPNQTPMETSTTNNEIHCEDSKSKSPQNGCEIIEQEDILCESNSINDASDAISDDEEQIVQQKPAKKRFQRETIIDDDLIIEEDSNDFKAEEELDLKMQQAETAINQLVNQATSSSNPADDDDDVIECSSDDDIICINDDEETGRVESDTSFKSVNLGKKLNTSNGHINSFAEKIESNGNTKENHHHQNGNTETNGFHKNGKVIDNDEDGITVLE